jgi:hypothetical protein
MVPKAATHRRIPKARENEPPTSRLSSHLQAKTLTLTSRLRNNTQDASRRRRSRTAGEARYVVDQAKQRRARIRSVSNLLRFHVSAPPPRTPKRAGERDTDMVDALPELPPSPMPIVTVPVSLPRYLARPAYREVSKEGLIAIEPHLEDEDMDTILEGLENIGPQYVLPPPLPPLPFLNQLHRMLQVLTGVKADPIKNALPKELSVMVNDLSSDAPSHMLALYSRHPPVNPASRRSVTLFPTHNIILAAYCANLPQLPPSDALRPERPGDKITVPIVPLCIPSPQTFPHLSAFLYAKNNISLLASLFSTRPPLSLSLDDEHSVRQFAGRLAATYITQALLHQIMTVNGLWRNACALGVFDDGLWGAMDLAWETLLTALTFATGSPLAMLDDQQKQS